EAFDAVHAGQLHIGEDEVEILLLEARDALLAAAGELNRVAARLEHVGQAFRQVAIVIDDEDRGFGVHAAMSATCVRGSQTTARVPRPGSLSSSMPPPWCSMICLTVGRPRPTPKPLVLKSGSKIRLNTSGGMPGPLSAISTSRRPPAIRLRTVMRCGAPAICSPPPSIACAALSTRL